MKHQEAPVNIFDQIGRICRRFRKRIAGGKSPKIESLLTEVPEGGRETLFSNLLEIELNFRQRRGDQPSTEEYLERFPQYAKQVRRAFFEPTLGSVNSCSSLDGSEPISSHRDSVAAGDTSTFEIPPANRLGDYELIRELGRGGMGVVYEARHFKTGSRVALKTLPTGHDGQEVNADRLYRFRREFRSLADINHPNLVGMQSLEVDGSQWFFTMDLIDGQDFLGFVRPEGRLDQVRLNKVLPQLVRGIIDLHQLRIVHRDVKPSNVLVEKDGTVKILDFGLVAQLQQFTSETLSVGTKHFAGTPRYAAPEQISGARSAAVDWYALGVMLYEAIKGDAPIHGAGVELMIKKQTNPSPPLSELADLPDSLSELAKLVDELLRRDPQERPGDIVIAQRLGLRFDSTRHDSSEEPSTDHDSVSSVSGEPSDSGWADQSSVTQDEFIIGREPQLTRLREVFDQFVVTRQSRVVLISGRSGEGKTTLANVFLRAVRQQGQCRILAGRCYDRESVPFKAVDSWIDPLVGFLRARPIEKISQWLPTDIQMLAHLFPVLRRVPAIADRCTADLSGIDSRQIRHRAFRALRSLLTQISRSTPLVLFIDDLQWGDADSAVALSEILAPPESPAVLLLGSYRTDEAQDSPFLTTWRQRTSATRSTIPETKIDVAPLTEEHCAQMLAQKFCMDIDQSRERAKDIFRETHGNPYFIEQLLEGFNPEDGRFHSVPLDRIIDQRLDRLSPEAGTLLDVIAVAGQAVPLEEIARVADAPDTAFATLTHMRSERLVRLIGSSDHQTIDTYHDKIRETILARTEPTKLRELHIQYGEYLEKIEGVSADDILRSLDRDLTTEASPPSATGRVFDLAFHFHAAEDERAFAYQLMAAEMSFGAYASEDAVQFLNRAAATPPREFSGHLRFRVLYRLASSLARLRRFDESITQFEKAVEVAGSNLQRALVHEGIGSVYTARSQYRLALDKYDHALAELGLSRPRGFAAVVRCFPTLIRIAIRPPQWQAQTSRDLSEVARYSLAQQINVNLLTFVWELPDSTVTYLNTVIRTLDFSYRVNEPGLWSGSIAWSGCHFALNGLPWMGKWLLRKAEPIARQIENEEAKACFLIGSAMTNHYSGNFKDADSLYAQAFERFLKSGHHNFVPGTAHMHRHLHAVIGTSATEVATGKRVLSTAKANDDSKGQCWGYYDIANGLARAGEIVSALKHIDLARHHLAPGERNLTDAIFLGTEGFVRLQASSYLSARLSLESAWNLIRRRKLLMDVTVRALPYLIESLIGPVWTHPVERGSANRLGRLCRAALCIAWLYPNIASPAQRARGRAYWAMGRKRKARRCFRKALRSAERFGADYDCARSLLDLAVTQTSCQSERRARAIQLLKEQESVIPHAERWQLGDQLDQAVVAPELEIQPSMGSAV